MSTIGSPIQTFNTGCKVLENYQIKLYCGLSARLNLLLYISDKYWSFAASSWSNSNVPTDWNEIYKVFVGERSHHVDLFSKRKERFFSINTSWGQIFGKCHCVRLGQVRLYIEFSYCDNKQFSQASHVSVQNITWGKYRSKVVYLL